jgi:hypothetical protein
MSWKSGPFMVTRVRPWTRAVAAISRSSSLAREKPRVATISPYADATLRSQSMIDAVVRSRRSIPIRRAMERLDSLPVPLFSSTR